MRPATADEWSLVLSPSLSP
uniref:Uncharacterized protein n=1 Tax=Arundo donax TaxID=35708 RepID=A0A0A8YRJ5_ARUDO